MSFVTNKSLKVALEGVKSELDNNLPTKVSLLENDIPYLTEKDLENIEVDTSDLVTKEELNNKVDKVTGKGLSTNDYTTDDKDKLGALPTNAELTTTLATKADNATVNTELAKKVDKVSGKQLSTEDFTAALKEKLNGLTNYDDTALDAKIEALKSRLDTLVGSGDVTAVIDTFQEIESFLQGVTNTQTLTGLLQEMKSEIIALIPTDYFKCDNYNNIDIDIDTVVKGGVYRVGGAKTSNLPSSSYQYGQLVVIRGGAVDTIAQMLFSYMPNVPIIVRQGNPIAVGGAGSWGNWRKLIEANGTSSQFLKADGSVDSTEYFPKSGGKINGTSAQPITLDTTYENNCVIKYLQDGIDKVYSGYSKANGAVLYNYTCDCFLGIKDDGTPHFNGSKLWHSGNFTPSNYLPNRNGVVYNDLFLNHNNDGGVVIYPTKVKGSQFNGFLFKNIDTETTFCGIGAHINSTKNEDGTYTNELKQINIGWGNNPWSVSNSLAISDTLFTYKNNKVWHEGNDGAGSGLDADLLDGKQGSSYFTKLTTANADELTGTDPIGSYEINRDNIGYVITNAPFNYGGLFHIGNKVSSCQFAYSSNNSLKFRARWNYPAGTSWMSWREIAFTDSNVASADKLITKQLTNEDLNDITEIKQFGVYYAIYNNTVANNPFPVGTSIRIICYGTSADYVTQIVENVNGGISYKRVRQNGTWQPWKKMLTEDDIASLVSRIEALENK